MPRGKAVPIILTRIQRRALENMLPVLELRCDRHSTLFAKYASEHGNSPQRDDYYVIPILKLRALLLASEGKNNTQISSELQISKQSIGRWRNEFSYILSRDDLPFDRIRHYFLLYYNPVETIIDGRVPSWVISELNAGSKRSPVKTSDTPDFV